MLHVPTLAKPRPCRLMPAGNASRGDEARGELESLGGRLLLPARPEAKNGPLSTSMESIAIESEVERKGGRGSGGWRRPDRSSTQSSVLCLRFGWRRVKGWQPRTSLSQRNLNGSDHTLAEGEGSRPRKGKTSLPISSSQLLCTQDETTSYSP